MVSAWENPISNICACSWSAAGACAVTMLRTAFGLIGMGKVDAAQVIRGARCKHLRERPFDVVFCDEEAGEVEGLSFALAARKSRACSIRCCSIFLVCTAPKRHQVEGARDDGLTDVLVRPISASTIVRKLKARCARPGPSSWRAVSSARTGAAPAAIRFSARTGATHSQKAPRDGGSHRGADGEHGFGRRGIAFRRRVKTKSDNLHERSRADRQTGFAYPTSNL